MLWVWFLVSNKYRFVGVITDMIRQATTNDLSRIAEIVVFNYRINFYPIFQNDDFYFNELQVPKTIDKYQEIINSIFVYDDGVVKGFIQIEKQEVKKLFVEPVLQGNSIGSKLLDFAIEKYGVNQLWALEKNIRAIEFYKRHGFIITDNRKLEEDTTEDLVRLER